MRTLVRNIFLTLLIWLVIFESSFSASKRPVRARHGMVVSAEELASNVGVQILRQGGTAVDAAVAVGFALAVTFPGAGNIGGGGFMLIRMADGRTVAIDYREKAPAAVHRDMFLDEKGEFVPSKSQEGYLSTGVPGSVAGLLHALEKHGTMSRKAVIQPAIDLARKGIRVSYEFAEDLRAQIVELRKHPATSKIFTKRGEPYAEGDLLLQKDLAETLRRIQRYGRDGFYKGKTADLIVAEMRRGGGLITHADLELYQSVERPPVRGTYKSYEVISIGPPSAGGIALVEMLNLLEPFDIAASGFASSKTVSLMAEAMKLAYADRAEYLGDPDFISVPVERLISKEYAAERRKLLDTAKATPSREISHGSIPLREKTETTHYSVVDRWGNAAAVTTTINGWYGNKIVVEGAGFFLNNEMDDFSAKPGAPNLYGLVGSAANSVEPNKRMLSSMTPTIVLKDGQPVMVLGSPGGSTIITTVFQVFLNVVEHRMNISEAIDAPRIHHQWFPDTLLYEKRGLAKDVLFNLEQRGYHLRERNGTQGRVEGIIIDRAKGVLYGATDPRGYGAAVGY